VTAVIQAATERSLFADPPEALAPVVEKALGELAAGMTAILPSPAVTGPGQPPPAVAGPGEAAPRRLGRPAARPENDEPPMAASG